MGIKSKMSRSARFLKWINNYPVPSNKKLAVLRDYIKLYNSKFITTEEYYDFEMEHQDASFRDSFLGVSEQHYYLDLLNPVKYYIFARNKYAAHKMFEKAGIKTSELYCYYEPIGRVSDSSEVATNVKDAVRILKSKGVTQCVIKATEESHGDNVIVVNAIEYLEDDCELHLFNGKVMKLSNVLKGEPRIFESVIKQTKQLSSFNESSVNTIRFMTTLYPDGSARVIATFIKIGRAGRCVDNAGGGGNVDGCVDIETGEIKYAIQFDDWRQITEIDKHPDSGAHLNGVIIENWDAIKAEVIKFQQAFPWCKAAGWDIAITDNRPVVIEVNDYWDRTGQFFIHKGWRAEIRDCYKSWKATGYKATRGRTADSISSVRLEKAFK